jgi:DNA-binding response OmpR family regulator
MEYKKRVLIVEDDPLLGELLLEHFRKEGINSELVVDGEKALDSILNNRPDLVLLDILLPKMSGLEMLKKLKEANVVPPLSVIILSNFMEEGKIKEGVELGAKEYMVKSNVDLNDITKKVKGILSIL